VWHIGGRFWGREVLSREIVEEITSFGCEALEMKRRR